MTERNLSAGVACVTTIALRLIALRLDDSTIASTRPSHRRCSRLVCLQDALLRTPSWCAYTSTGVRAFFFVCALLSPELDLRCVPKVAGSPTSRRFEIDRPSDPHVFFFFLDKLRQRVGEYCIVNRAVYCDIILHHTFVSALCHFRVEPCESGRQKQLFYHSSLSIFLSFLFRILFVHINNELLLNYF